MNYLQRLARRLTGLAPENSLQPGARRQQDGFDPFDNWVITPATISLTSRRQAAETKIAPRANENSLPEHRHQDIDKTDKPANKTEIGPDPGHDPGKVTPEKDSARRKIDKTVSNKKSVRAPQLKARDRAVVPDVAVNADTRFAGKKSKQIKPVQDLSVSKPGPDDSKANAITGQSKLFARLRHKVSAGRLAGDVLPSINKSGPKSHSVITASVSTEADPASIQPTYAKAKSVPAVRRKKSATSRAETPRLVIGSLRVDVVAIDDKPKHAHASAAVTRKAKSIRARDIGRRSVKMKFGLGQM